MDKYVNALYFQNLKDAFQSPQRAHYNFVLVSIFVIYYIYIIIT